MSQVKTSQTCHVYMSICSALMCKSLSARAMTHIICNTAHHNGRARQKTHKNRRQHKNRRTTGGQGPGKANNWRAGSREGGQLAGKNRKHTNQGGSPPRPPVAPRGLSQESLPTSWPRCFSPLLARQLSHMGFPANPGELLLIFSMLCCL